MKDNIKITISDELKASIEDTILDIVQPVLAENSLNELWDGNDEDAQHRAFSSAINSIIDHINTMR